MRTTVQTRIRSPGFDSAVVSCCCWSPGPCSSRYQRLSYFFAPLPDPPNWERLLLRKSELKRQRKIENRYLCESTRLLRAKEWPNERSKELNLWGPKLIEGAPLSPPLIISISSSSCHKPTGSQVQCLKSRRGRYMMAVGRSKGGKHCSGWRENHIKQNQTRGLGKRSGENSDSCKHVVLGDGLSVCQSRYFCLFSAALLAARDTPRVIAGCLLSLAKKERGRGVCARARLCALKGVCACVSGRVTERETRAAVLKALLLCQYI